MKTLIECTTGPATTTIGGETYAFERDEYGRYVNDVQSLLHRALLLSVVHYSEVPIEPEKPDDMEIPSFLSSAPSEGTVEAEPEVKHDTTAKSSSSKRKAKV